MDTSNLLSYIYTIKSAYFLYSNGDTYDITKEYITLFSISKEFDKAHFPVFHIKMNIHESQYRRIMSEKLTTKIKLRVQKHSVDQVTLNESIRDDYFDELFIFIVTDDTPFLAKDAYTTKINTASTNDEDRYSREFFLYKETDLINSKTPINMVLKNANISDAILYSLTASKSKKVLMENPHNGEIYDELLIPPLTMQGCINYLSSTYGIYKTGLSFFFDIDIMYLISKSDKCKVYRENEIRQTVFYIPKSGNTNDIKTGSVVENGIRVIILVPYTDINITNESIANDQLVGNKMIVSRPNMDTVDTINPETIQIGNSTVKFLEGGSNNGFSASAMEYALNESNYVVTIGVTDFDVSSTTPNKEFLFIYEDKEINEIYGGTHRLVKEDYIFNRTGEKFLLKGQLTFRRCKKSV